MKGRLLYIFVYVDSLFVVNVIMIFGVYLECFDNQLYEYMFVDDNLFGFNVLEYVKFVEVLK